MLDSHIGCWWRKLGRILEDSGLAVFDAILPAAIFARFAVVPRAGTLLRPGVVFWMMVTAAISEGPMCAAVKRFWSWSYANEKLGMSVKAVSPQAFTRARRLLPVAFFRRVFEFLVARYESRFGARFRYHGLTLLGIDGTNVRLPMHPELRRVFPSGQVKDGRPAGPSALLVSLVGLTTGFCRRFALVPTVKGSEQMCARWLSRSLKRDDLLLADKNFVSIGFIEDTVRRGAKFLARLASNRFTTKRQQVTPSGRSDEYYIRVQRDPRDSKWKQRDKQRKGRRKDRSSLGLNVVVRVIEYQLKGFRPSRLLTNLLDTEEFPHKELVELYHQRWRHETIYREWKHTLDINNLRSHSREGIIKEVFVQITANNLLRWLMTESLAKQPDLRPVDLSFLEAKRIAENTMERLANEPAPKRRSTRAAMRAEFAAATKTVRPGRNYPRPHDHRSKNRGYGYSQQPARLPATHHPPHSGAPA